MLLDCQTSASLLLDCYWILHVFQPSDWTSGMELAPAGARISFTSRFDLVFDLVFSRLRFPGHVYAYITTITCDECIKSCGRSTHSVLGDSEGQMGDKWGIMQVGRRQVGAPRST